MWPFTKKAPEPPQSEFNLDMIKKLGAALLESQQLHKQAAAQLRQATDAINTHREQFNWDVLHQRITEVEGGHATIHGMLETLHEKVNAK
jgi:hypothetical protein